MIFRLCLLLSFLLTPFLLCAQQSFQVASPSQAIQVTVGLSDSIYYAVAFQGEPILHPSALALVTDAQTLGANPRLLKKEERSREQQISPPVAEKRAVIKDHYNELELFFRGRYSLIFRVYDDGVAYRWHTNLKDTLIIQHEIAHFHFVRNDTIYFPELQCQPSDSAEFDCFHSSFEELYKVVPIGEIHSSQRAFLPVLVDGKKRYKMLITEADLTDYPGMFVSGTDDSTFSLRGEFAPYPLQEKAFGEYTQDVVVKRAEYIARTWGQRMFPWRVLIITPDERLLPETDMVYRLSAENKVGDMSWFKPGKSTSEWILDNNIYGVDFRAGYNTRTYQYYIDFAHRFGLEYVLFDAGWSAVTDLFSITPAMDMEFLTRYAREKKVGLVLWTSAYALRRQMQPALDTLQAWGIKGIMVDFMNRDDQPMVNFYESVARETAKRHIFVDFHGSYKPTGLRRQYPNIVTREGAIVQEYYKWASDVLTPEYEVTLPFIRGVAGPLDYEPGNMLNETKENHHPMFNKPTSLGTRIHQLAMFIIYESPYAKMGGNPSDYLREPEYTQFMVNIPTVWKETKTIEAQLADYVVLRRETLDGTFYIGAMTDWTPRDFSIKLDFLPEGPFRIDIYQDGINADRYASDYQHIQKTVSREDTLEIHLAPGGGWVARIYP